MKQRFRGRDQTIYLICILLGLLLTSVFAIAEQGVNKNRGYFKNFIDHNALSQNSLYRFCRLELDKMKKQGKLAASKVMGGPCEYRKYKGKAKITSVHKREMPDDYGMLSYETYEVRFSFHTNQKVEEAHGKVEGKEYTLMLNNSWYPGPKFLQKYGIEVGKSFDCYLKVITKGTCTPILFEFSSIDLSDYFEHRR